MLRRSIELCDKINWNNPDRPKYCIEFDYDLNSISFSTAFVIRDFGQIYFDTREHAEQVAEEFEDELLWYHTEFKERMD